MANTLVKQSLTSYIPAVAEVIAQPARCVTETRRELVTRWTTTTVFQGNQWYWYSTPYTQWEDVSRTICYPAVAGVAGRDAQVVTDNQLGWNAGAVSKAVRAGDLLAAFVVPSGVVGALCGLAPSTVTVGQFGAIEHGILLAEGSLPRVVERGAVVATAPNAAAGTRLLISRTGDKVTYVVGSWSYTSANPSLGAKALAAVLYCGGDSVDNPALNDAASLKVGSGWGWSSPAEQGQMQARSGWGWGGYAALNDGYAEDLIGVTMFAADYDYGSASGEVADLQLSASSGFYEVEVSGSIVPLPLSMAAVGIDVDVGSVEAPISIGMFAADYDYGSASGEVADFAVSSAEVMDPPGAGSYTEAVAGVDAYSYTPTLYAVISEGIAVGSVLDVLLAIDGTYADYLALTDEANATMILEAAISAGLQFDDNAASVARTLLQYATNVATGGVSRYQGFDFAGFARVESETYGWKADGLYRIGADTDDGALISALVEFAAEDFGTAARKRLDNIFLGLGTDGQVFLRLLDDNDKEVVYRARQRGSEYRTDTQRGASSRFWRLRLELVDASYAELDNVEWVVGATGRRTTR